MSESTRRRRMRTFRMLLAFSVVALATISSSSNAFGALIGGPGRVGLERVFFAQSIEAKALVDHECNDSEWHFVITQIDVEANAPASIHVTWANGNSEDVPLEKYTGKTAHYTTFSNLDSTVVSATATIYDGWDGQFNLSHGPCGEGGATETPTNTPTDTPTNTPTDTPTSTNTPTDTPTNTATAEVTETPTDTPTNTPTDTPTSTPTDTPTNTPTDTPTNTPTDTATNTPTDTPTNTPTDTATNTPTDTPTNTPPTTVDVTETPTNTPTDTPTNTPGVDSETETPTNTPTDTSTPTETPGGDSVVGPETATAVPTETPTEGPAETVAAVVAGGDDLPASGIGTAYQSGGSAATLLLLFLAALTGMAGWRLRPAMRRSR